MSLEFQLKAYALASEIEEVRARCVVAQEFAKRRRPWWQEYDPLAATCLAELIIKRLGS